MKFRRPGNFFGRSDIFIGWIFYGLGTASIFPLRRAAAGKAIPYCVPGYPWTPLLFALGLPAYFFWRKRASSPA